MPLSPVAAASFRTCDSVIILPCACMLRMKQLDLTGDHSISDIQRCKILLRLDIDILQVTSSVGPSRKCIWIPGCDQRDRQPIISVRTRMGFDRSMYRVANAECTRECIHLRSLYNPQL
ncbi:hypothetical protein CY34DRAFT_814050 [Suillus luteus UH-Slu-Lm8-n1]|uniref:Uncharacterized protein n=1 Tax=Suillus luteus UH-Slu-Lm8-n1 TaxID=930992 RepID=A0A0D0ALP2_9AGAM|nr:hypothetical protein CY34DRAFT_814050 [Suillus luteus UH-Slu-Lm8-n1]